MKKIVLIFNILCLSASAMSLQLMPVKDKRCYSLSAEFIHYLRKLFPTIDVFVETGTYKGDTTLIASTVYSKVHTIEIADYYFNVSQEQFKNHNAKNIISYKGDSVHLLDEIARSVNGKAIFWLDAHFCGDKSGKSALDSPIVQELEILSHFAKENPVILIDDIREFYRINRYDKNAGYPSVAELERIILRLFPNYEFYIMGDVAIAYSKSLNLTVDPLIKACTTSYVADSIEDILKAELLIMNASPYERTALFQLADSKELRCAHSMLWKGLILMHDKNIEAYKYFEAAEKMGIQDGRTLCYKKLLLQ